MFTRDDLAKLLDVALEEIPYSLDIPYIKIERSDIDFRHLHPNDMYSTYTLEPIQSPYIHEPVKAANFWLYALWDRQYHTDPQRFKEYAMEALFISLSQDDFERRFKKRADSLKGFRGAILMYDDWYDQGFFAEYEDEYIAVFETRTS